MTRGLRALGGPGIGACRSIGASAVRESSLDGAAARVIALEPRVMALENGLDIGRCQRNSEARTVTSQIQALQQSGSAA